MTRLLCALALALTSCATVAPYEREGLARPTMSTAREGTETGFRAHMQESREGTAGGYGGAGGGCGCN